MVLYKLKGTDCFYSAKNFFIYLIWNIIKSPACKHTVLILSQESLKLVSKIGFDTFCKDKRCKNIDKYEYIDTWILWIYKKI